MASQFPLEHPALSFSLLLTQPIFLAVMVPCKHLSTEEVKFMPLKFPLGDFLQLGSMSFLTQSRNKLSSKMFLSLVNA